jgi:hypothetical protein
MRTPSPNQKPEISADGQAVKARARAAHVVEMNSPAPYYITFLTMEQRPEHDVLMASEFLLGADLAENNHALDRSFLCGKVPVKRGTHPG